MKLVIAIIQNDDERALLSTLMKRGFRATKLASTGGFLRTGNTTVMIGAEDAQLSSIFDILHSTCRSRKVIIPSHPRMAESEADTILPAEAHVGGATVFVVPIEQNITL